MTAIVKAILQCGMQINLHLWSAVLRHQENEVNRLPEEQRQVLLSTMEQAKSTLTKIDQAGVHCRDDEACGSSEPEITDADVDRCEKELRKAAETIGIVARSEYNCAEALRKFRASPSESAYHYTLPMGVGPDYYFIDAAKKANSHNRPAVTDVNGQPIVAYPGEDADAVSKRFCAMKEQKDPLETLFKDTGYSLSNLRRSFEKLADLLVETRNGLKPASTDKIGLYKSLKERGRNTGRNFCSLAVDELTHIDDAKSFMDQLVADHKTTDNTDNLSQDEWADRMISNMRYWSERYGNTAQMAIWKKAIADVKASQVPEVAT